MGSIASGDAIRVLWQDSKSHQGWVPLDYPYTPGQVTSLGFVVQSDEEGLTIANTISKEPQAANAPFTIPWSCVQAWEVLEGVDAL